MPHCYGNSHAILDHLPTGKGDIPAFTQPIKAGTGFSNHGGVQG